MYSAIIARAMTREHPNADNLQQATAAGHQVIVGLDVPDGALGVLFPSDGQLSLRMASENNLHRHPEFNKDPTVKGYFEDNRRVRTLTLRGERSEGVWLPLSSLDWTGSTMRYVEGMSFDTLNGERLCNKYETPATKRARDRLDWRQQAKARGRKVTAFAPDLRQHYSTPKARYMLNRFGDNPVTITEKLHGTSARTGHLPLRVDLPWYKRQLNAVARLFRVELPFPERAYGYVSGTRRVVLSPEYKHTRDPCRSRWHDEIARRGLKRGETLFYEIVGYNGPEHGPIMSTYTPPKDETGKAISRQYGDCIVFNYGCAPGDNAMYVYRMTMTTGESDVIEYSWEQIEARCSELALDTVPVVARNLCLGDADNATQVLSDMTDGPSGLDPSHPTEGVCIRYKDKAYKWKGFEFCHLEGIRKNDASYVDTEEIS